MNGIGFVVVPIRVWKAQVWIGFIAGGNHVCKMRDGALVCVLGILIFDKRAFAIQVFKFGAFFLNEVRFAWLKVGRTDKLERSHVSDRILIAWICWILIQFLLNFIQNV
ncbi:MAG: hypothetical protein EBQ97_07845, partial [Bacteroidetes bacterium]|nr:hypothetical protein [Bacteroidota bacterium]